jgi:hypothetical protein
MEQIPAMAMELLRLMAAVVVADVDLVEVLLELEVTRVVVELVVVTAVHMALIYI